VGLHFVKLAKNYAFVPRPFAGMLREMYGEAAFVVDDETEGATPAEKLKVGADALNGAMTRLLVTTCGIESLMGAPLRTIVLDGSEETDRRWLKECIHRNAVRDAEAVHSPRPQWGERCSSPPGLDIRRLR
jgi:hypothetical protein